MPQEKDGGTIYEKKMLMAALMLGIDVTVLTPEGYNIAELSFSFKSMF